MGIRRDPEYPAGIQTGREINTIDLKHCLHGKKMSNLPLGIKLNNKKNQWVHKNLVVLTSDLKIKNKEIIPFWKKKENRQAKMTVVQRSEKQSLSDAELDICSTKMHARTSLFNCTDKFLTSTDTKRARLPCTLIQ